MTDFNLFLPLTKVEKQKDGSVIVSGYASTPSLDLDGERVSLDAVKKALPGYWEWRNIREMHQPSAVGVGKEANVDENGLFLTSKIVDPTAAKKCLDGVYKGYSIGGKKLAKNGEVITEIELIEVSVVDRPANPDCRISVAKRAKENKEAYLLKAKVPKSKERQALSKMAEAVQILSKVGPAPDPPAARDGFSLPAPGPNRSPKDKELQNNKASGACEEHGVVGCQECMDKISDEARGEAKDEGKTQPGKGERFPIRNKKDLDNARQAVGRSKTPGKTRAWIRTRAKDLGVKLPDNWKKKEAKKLIKEAEQKSAAVRSIPDSLLTLPRIKQVFPAPLDKEPDFLTLEKVSTMDPNAVSNGSDSDLDTAVLNILKRSMEPSRDKRMTMARGDLKKAQKARKEARDEIKECHAAISKRYMAKMAKASKKPDDDDDDDMASTEKVLKSLQKAYSAMTTMKTFIKAADSHLVKAASRSGQRGQEAGDPSSSGTPINTPTGMKDLSPGAMARAGGGSEPPMYPTDGGVYPGKMAKLADKNGMIPAAVAEVMAENARLESQVALLGRASNPGQRPYAFDMGKVYGVPDQQGGNRQKSDILFSGVNPNDLQSQDENIRTKAAATVTGNYLLSSSFGKSIVDPAFRGHAGMGRS